MDAILNMLAPIMPMITYRIYKELRGKDIHFEPFAMQWKIHENVQITREDIVELNSSSGIKERCWKSLKEEVQKLVIDEKFKSIQHDIISAHNVKKLEFGERGIEL